MIIFPASAIKPAFSIPTPWGDQTIIFYEGKLYMLAERYESLEEAIADHTRDLAAGFSSFILEETVGASLWCSLPTQIQASILKTQGNLSTAPSPNDNLATDTVKTVKSWFNLMMHLAAVAKSS